jgi:hypothetical protein
MYYRLSNAPGAQSGIYTVDFSNAFNTMRRASIDAEVAARFPELLPYAPYLQTLRAPTAQAEATSAAQASLPE